MRLLTGKGEGEIMQLVWLQRALCENFHHLNFCDGRLINKVFNGGRSLGNKSSCKLFNCIGGGV